MNATVLDRSYTPRRTRQALAALAVAALLGLALVTVGDFTPATASTAAAPEPAPAPAAEARAGDAPVATPALAPKPETPRRPARRHRQPLSMPFFSFAARS